MQPRHLLAWLLALAICIALLATAELWRSYFQIKSVAERNAGAFSRLLAEQTERMMQAIDLTLLGMRDALRVAPGLPVNDAAFREGMLHRLAHLPHVRALFVIGPDGFVVHDTDYPMTPRVSLADRAYFQRHRDEPEGGMQVGHPLRSRSVNTWFISMSRRITNPDGSFGGVVVAAIEPDYFKSLYSELSMGESSEIYLLLTDGTLLVRVPHHEASISSLHRDEPMLTQAWRQHSGIAWSVSPTDGVGRILGYRNVSTGGLIVIAGWSAHAIYRPWREHAAIIGFASILVWGLASWLAVLWFKHERREQMERARLAQGRRLEMMGRIAGGIAHDLGNTIKIARTTFTLLKPSLAAQHEAMTLVEDADRSLKSAFEIIDRLLAFARRQELSPQPTNLAELITGFAPILRQATGPCIELEIDVGKPLVCLVDPIHLESALLNLVLNSKDAMPGVGRIVVELREVEPPYRRRKSWRPPSPAAWAEIAVTDDGRGMSRHVLEHAFEPFFTTRAGGSGLGLSQVLGFVKQSAGEVRIDSRPGEGTKVRLLFPLAANGAAAAAPAVDWAATQVGAA